MFDARYLGRPRKELVEVTFPARRIEPVAVTPRRCPIQNLFYSPAQSSSRFGLVAPDGCKDREDVH